MTRYNLGSRNPHSDVCSYCEEQNKKFQMTIEKKDKKEMMILKQIYKLRAKKFYTHFRYNPSGTVAFDCQQNQTLPKLSVSDTFYSRVVQYKYSCIISPV